MAMLKKEDLVLSGMLTTGIAVGIIIAVIVLDWLGF